MSFTLSHVRIRKPIIVKILLLVVILLILLTLTGIIAYYYITRPDFLKKQLLSILKDKINGKVSIEDVGFELSSGLNISELEIRYQSKELIEQEIEIITVPHLNIKIDYESIVHSLLNFELKPAFKLITIDKPNIVVRFDKTGEWLDRNIWKTKGTKSGGKASLNIPQIIVHNAQIDLEFPMIFDEGNENRVSNISFSILQDSEDPDLFDLKGYAESSEFGIIEVEAFLDQNERNFDIRIFNHNVLLSSKRIKNYIPEIQDVYEDFISSAGEGKREVQAEIIGRLLFFEKSPALVEVDVKIIEGTAKYYKFPVPVSINAGHIKLRNHKKTSFPEFGNQKQLIQMCEQNIPSGNLSAELNLQGSYKDDNTKLQANISNIGSVDETLSIVLDAYNILIDSDFRKYIGESDEAPEALRTFLKEFRASGIADVKFVAGKSTIQISIDVKNVNVNYTKFPYPISSLQGRVEGAEELWEIIDVKGATTNTDQDVSFNVKIRRDEFEKTIIIINISSTGITVEKELSELLPKQVQEVLAEHNIKGTVSIESSEFIYTEGSDDLGFKLKLSPVNVSYQWDRFPYKVNFEDGLIEIEQEIVRFENVVGFNDWTRITLNGWIATKSTDGKGSFDLKLDIENLEIGKEIENAIFNPLPKGVDTPDKTIFVDLWNMFQPGGVIDLSLRISPDLEQDIFVIANIVRANVIYEKFPLPIEVDSGRIEFRNFNDKYYIVIENLSGKYKNANVQLEGSLQGEKNSMFLHIVVQNCIIDEKLKKAYEHLENIINEDRENDLYLWKTLQPAGTLDMMFDIYTSSSDNLEVCMQVDISEGKATFAYFPYELIDITGRVFVDNKGVHLSNIIGYHSETKLEIVEGQILSDGYRIKQVITNSLVDKEFLDAIPKEWKPLIETLDIKGRFNGIIEAQIQDIETEKPTIKYTAKIELPYNSINVGLEIDELTGVISITGLVNEDTIYTIANINFSSAKWQKYKVTSGSMDLIFKDNKISIPNFTCRAYNGIVTGRIALEIGESTPFNGYFKFAGLSISEFLRNISSDANELKGTISGDMAIYGNLPPRSGFEGIVEFHVSEAWIIDIPIVLKLFDFVNYFNPTPIDEIFGKAKILQDKTEIIKLDLFSDAIALYGKGVLHNDASLEMKFNIDISPRALLYPKPIRWFVKKIEKIILPVYIVGDLQQPKFYAVFPPGTGTHERYKKGKLVPDSRPRKWRITPDEEGK
ncbi:MAG: hypothetical protein K8S87_00035 [Planctomycetes bacterium]|nr:hypothetical protein [Planctomycetota bacterium]